MRGTVFLGLMALPCLAFGSTDCRVLEYADHFEAICIGDAQEARASPPASAPQPAPQAQISAPFTPAPEQASGAGGIMRSDLAKRQGDAWFRMHQRH